MNLSQTIEQARNVLRFKHMAYKTENRLAAGGKAF